MKTVTLMLLVMCALHSYGQIENWNIIEIDSDNTQYKDEIVDKSIIESRAMLDYDMLREADVIWEKRVWRIIDAKEKLNYPFLYSGSGREPDSDLALVTLEMH